jgi:hypothetical protein
MGKWEDGREHKSTGAASHSNLCLYALSLSALVDFAHAYKLTVLLGCTVQSVADKVAVKF